MKKKKNYCIIVILFLMSCLFVILNSLGIIYSCNNGDSTIFNTIGKFWNEGKIPYVDLFDHKGPLIFLINMISWKLFNCEQGILLFQAIFLFFTLIFLFKIAKLQIVSNKKSLFFTILTLLFLVFTYAGGNMTEEYCLPFITLSLYLNLKYLKDYERFPTSEHNKKYAFVYGISFAVCFLTRLTNAVSISVGILVILGILVKEKKIKNILANAIFFLLGFLVLYLPFAIYFAKENAFYEFMEGTILFNFKYATAKNNFIEQGSFLKKLVKYFIIYFPSCIIFLISIIKLKNKKNTIGIFYFLLGLFEIILFMKSRLYTHYATICLPNFLIGFMELEKYKIDQKYKIILYLIVIIVCVSGLIGKVYKSENRKLDYSIYDNLMYQIPEEERESFIAVDVSFRGIYEHYNICPYYKYFVLQDFQANNSKELYNKMYEVFLNGNVKWILFEGDIEKSLIKNIVKRRYDIIDKKENIILYELND